MRKPFKLIAVKLSVWLLLLGGIFSTAAPSLADTGTIPLKELPANSRIAIWGDSITEITLSPRYIETYLLACAGRKDVKLCTFGHSGETMAGLLSRRSDLDAFKPTLVTFNYGMNDTQYSPYTSERGAAFDKTTREVLALLISKGINQRVVVGPGMADDTYGVTNSAAFFKGADSGGLTAAQAQNVTLGHFHDFARAAAVDTGSAYADTYDRINDAYTAAKKVYGPKYDFAGPGGGIHPAANGHLMIAYEILKALACDGTIADIQVDMKGSATASTGHTVVSCSNGTVVLDSSRYPFCYNYDPQTSNAADSMASILPFLPFSQDLNRFMLKVSHLEAASADVTWGSETKRFTREQLEQGINLGEQFAHTPFDATFAKVIEAVGDKQNFENFMIKGTSNYFGNDNGGNVDDNMIAVQAQKDAAVKAMIVPVRHAIVITPAGATETVAPIITGTMMAYATTGQGFSYKPSALHSPTAFTASGLPKGLEINPTTGEITGTPADAGNSTIALTATNSFGSGTAVISLSVTDPMPPMPEIKNTDKAIGTIGEPFAIKIDATGSPTHYFVTCQSDRGHEAPESSLPPGLGYDSATGVMSGTPTTAGDYIVQLAAMNSAGVASKIIKLTIAAK